MFGVCYPPNSTTTAHTRHRWPATSKYSSHLVLAVIQRYVTSTAPSARLPGMAPLYSGYGSGEGLGKDEKITYSKL